MSSIQYPAPIPPLNIAELLKQYGLRAKKRLGQNFLQDEHILEKIADAAQIDSTDTVLEIGPGLGSLTRYLAACSENVVAIELDENLFPALEAVLGPYKNVQLIHGDILKIEPEDLIKRQDYLVVANIPYYITSAVIRHLLESNPKPRRVVLTIQKEVAARICADAGKMSLLALSVQVYGKPHIVMDIPAGAFFPSPKVDSALLIVDIYDNPLIETELLNIFFQLTKAGFSQKRKKLRNSISAGIHLSKDETEKLLLTTNIDPQRRAETLSLEEWGNLSRQYRNE
ncbi:MAG: 16S rRNA (adenine(1518)-N(6)/adenine(1519)-N(6))-dimethyltransferase RsmA [Anaerolineae bacterium]|nr:16S rRNA (adenine(1518)-N(6)/adenine(1519)-N(6))-dimethyltransferase RsmA [Anaerolineae bacterium]MDK1081452.1 16S rRNA (adenine(1518)-N(6)/adenine(1519)-N(6))-dimethyltransferase RsmA [Anaerolineae bacterium]MDK1117895.1 16S rRNA (adenine(1518)-N(6)/adenine(1519)-N(6))-dimethyltransferase RsmA [Anaerolineae bacterium]